MQELGDACGHLVYSGGDEDALGLDGRRERWQQERQRLGMARQQPDGHP